MAKYEIIDGTLIVPDGAVTLGEDDLTGELIDDTWPHELLEKVVLPDSLVEIESGLFSQCVNLRDVRLPSGLEVLPDWLFDGCKSLETIELPENLRLIGNAVFRNSGLKEIKIPASVVQLSGYSFSHCRNLKKITVAKENPVYDSRERCNGIVRSKFNELVVGCETTKIVTSIESMGLSAFCGCGLTKIKIPDTVTRLDADVFNGCDLLEHVTMSRSVKELKEYVFFGCKSLRKIELPAVNKIAMMAFYESSDLEEVKIGETNVEIAQFAFQGCASLKKVTIGAHPAPLEDFLVWKYGVEGAKSYMKYINKQL